MTGESIGVVQGDVEGRRLLRLEEKNIRKKEEGRRGREEREEREEIEERKEREGGEGGRRRGGRRKGAREAGRQGGREAGRQKHLSLLCSYLSFFHTSM